MPYNQTAYLQTAVGWKLTFAGYTSSFISPFNLEGESSTYAIYSHSYFLSITIFVHLSIISCTICVGIYYILYYIILVCIVHMENLTINRVLE